MKIITLKQMDQWVDKLCLHFPETSRVISRGSPNFRVRDRNFAIYLVNHHGDGFVALWLNADFQQQQHYLEENPDVFFIPPYLGVKGWIGMKLDQGLSWSRMSEVVQTAYLKTAPKTLHQLISPLPKISTGKFKIDAIDVDPMQAEKHQKILKKLRKLALALPETSETTQFGDPTFKAGKKSFCTLSLREGRLGLAIWVGVESQEDYIEDQRFTIPAYIGHRGWIVLAINAKSNWQEIASLVEQSYRHFALKRMINILDNK